ncbi:protein serine/threonine phosphatase 2C [Piromyces finnis]|uniref:Protein serine/threonine phosphatase 2C n=1 Tax=Piromyces finnis TaxID=1754191 RepID=A0A1Y1UWP6_9FUNG|nr:protein serine/threonine phosphatase 2C [Piromyces finnis]|eukprot:ORX41641.1 protein serine/threonine phosphatase 2C [Piromyces finnis]
MKNYLENFESYGICVGGNANEPSKEDRILVIDDLIEYVRTNYSKYKTTVFGDSKPPYPEILIKGIDDSNSYKLYGVFDGHCGSIASSFLKQRFPFELLATADFKAGNYKEALSKTFTNLHKELLSCSKYTPELFDCLFCSGSTASVALVTPTFTYFAFLGDSPIITWRNKSLGPEFPFSEHSIDNFKLHNKIIESNVFFSVYLEDENEPYQILAAGDKTRVEILDRMKKDYEKPHALPFSKCQYPMDALIEKEDLRVKTKIYPDDIRVGFSKLNVLGSIGDSIYDPKIFNVLIDEIEHYRKERVKAYDNLIKVLTSKKPVGHTISDPKRFKFEFEKTGMTIEELRTISPVTYTYESIRSFIIKQERWQKLLKNHIRLPESFDTSSILCSALMNFHPHHKLRAPGLKRQPDVISVLNCDLKLFILASDGVIKYYSTFKNKYNDIIIKNHENLKNMARILIEYMSFLGDDRSVVCCHY